MFSSRVTLSFSLSLCVSCIWQILASLLNCAKLHATTKKILNAYLWPRPMTSSSSSSSSPSIFALWWLVGMCHCTTIAPNHQPPATHHHPRVSSNERIKKSLFMRIFEFFFLSSSSSWRISISILKAIK